MPHDVFVSYCSEDKPTADAVCATLENHGVRCWIAPRDVLPGMDWGAAIIDAINASRIMVLVYSAKANESQQIKREVERAVNKGMPLIPFRIEDVPMSKTLEYFISTPHWLDALSGPLQQHLDKLAETTALILEQAGVALAPPPVGRAAQPAPPITSSREIVRGIGGWVKGGQEAPTLSQVFLPKSDKIANVALIAGSVLAILILAQIKLGPIWLLPLGALLVGAGIGSRSGALAVLIFVALGVVGLPVFGGGQSAWSTLGSRGSYMQEALGMMVGLIAATFTVGWLAERRLWDRRFPTAAALALIGVALIYLPGRIWAEILALFMRQASAEISFLPSIPMLVITVAVMTVALPMTWSWLNGKREPKLESSPQELASGSPSNVPEAQTAAAEAEPKT